MSKAFGHVFISYSREDSSLMRRLARDLRSQLAEVWTDDGELRPGTRRWKQAIEQAIEEARCVVVVLTPSAKASEWVALETTYARTLDKPIIPWLAAGDVQSSVPIDLIDTQWVDHGGRYQPAFDELFKAVATTGTLDLSGLWDRASAPSQTEATRRPESGSKGTDDGPGVAGVPEEDGSSD